eukprot:TRINITY_DN8435_c0_g1_i1.p1 TRINITY_DN8435_c0_g1~~TRINITY_DN8435_c0_g1_i1.p1  ORF type:complete len:451 (+),score=150.17 TRINITY_DN8435_c0_g1_i1:80-1432(+)
MSAASYVVPDEDDAGLPLDTVALQERDEDDAFIGEDAVRQDILTVVEITGVDEATARAALDAHGWSVDMAVLECVSGGQGGPGAGAPAEPGFDEVRAMMGMFPGLDYKEVAAVVTRYRGDQERIVEELLEVQEDEEREWAGEGPVKVYLNVYNLAPERSLDKLGIGVFHSGIEIYGKEWGFGGSSEAEHADLTGVFWVDPRSALVHFFKQIELGTVHKSQREIRNTIIKPLQAKWKIGTYHVIQNNCNHFATILSRCLGVKAPPPWVNRAARIGDAVVPNRVINYFLKGNLPPPQAPEDTPVKSRAIKDIESGKATPQRQRGRSTASASSSQARNASRSRKKLKNEGQIVGEWAGQLFHIGDTVRYAHMGGHKYPDETDHPVKVYGDYPVRGMTITAADDNLTGVVSLCYPRQRFVEVDTGEAVILGPFRSKCNLSCLEHDDGSETRPRS